MSEFVICYVLLKDTEIRSYHFNTVKEKEVEKIYLFITYS